MVSGASGFKVIAWSHGHEGGNFFDSTGSNMFVCLQYSSGTSMSCVNLPDSLDNSMEIPLSEDSHSSSRNIGLCHCLHFTWILRPLIILAMRGRIRDFLQSVECMMMGRKEVSMTVSLHLNFGSKVESQG